jgi:23S rRNA (guanosine2251-2'-O)-methyltransferase
MEMKEWITGRNPVYECLCAERRYFFRLLINKGSSIKGRIGDILKIARRKRISVETVDKNYLSNIADHHQGVALEASKYPYTDIYTIFNRVEQTEKPMFILMIDQIQDVQNLGTLIRSAEIFGVHGMVIPPRRAAGITPAVVKASSGASEHLMITQMNIRQAIDELKKKGAWIVGLDMDDSAESLEQINLDGPLAVVVGSEGHGLRRLVREKCDHIAYIPMQGKVASLNAAVAGSIALYKAAVNRKNNS